MKSFKVAKITLVGAGPGDPDLLTLKGLKAIKSADVILYDALASKVLLDHNPGAHHVFVGKRRGCQAFSQEEITALMIDFTYLYSHVVRLKGGDPMVFGRAAEEIEAARRYGIEVEVIPGISSYSAMAAYNQMPLTRRGECEGFWVTTGTTRSGEVSADLRLAAQSTATVVVLMGMSKLAEIVRLFRMYKPGEYPVCIVQHVSLEEERLVSGTLDNIVARRDEEGIDNPAVIVLGEAARHATARAYLQPDYTTRIAI